MQSRYLVCFKAGYAYSEHNFDAVVEWNGYDVEALRNNLREGIRKKYCNDKKDVSISITFVSVFELKKEETNA